MRFRHRHERDLETSPFDPAPAAPAQVVPPTPTPTPMVLPTTDKIGSGCGGGHAGSTPFTGMYDPVPIAPTPTGSGPSATQNGQTADPHTHTVLLTGITDNQNHAEGYAQDLNGNGNAYAAYDGNKVNPQTNPTDKMTDMASDALAVLQYSMLGNSYAMGSDGQVHASVPFLPNVHLPFIENMGLQPMPFGGEQYQSPAQVGQGGAAAAVGPNYQNAPSTQKQEPVVVDAHSGGGQSAFFTAVELHNAGYTNISINGYDMAMTPKERAQLEAMGVQVTNTTSHIGTDDNYVISPVAGIIQMAMGGGPGYYDNNIQTNMNVVNAPGKDANGNPIPADPLQQVTNWHGFQNPISTPYLQNQNQQAANGTLQNPTQNSSGDILIPVGHLLWPNVPILNNFYANIDPNAQAQTQIDLSHGSMSSSINLSGTTIDTPFTHNTIGDWAQASRSVDLSQGAASVNVGGDHGVGADVNLSQGQIDLNLLGNHIDVDQGIHNTVKNVSTTARNVAHNVGNTVSNTAHNVANTASNVVHNVVDTASNVAHNVGNTVSNTAHNVANTASNVVHNVVDTASNVAHNVGNTVSNTAHNVVNTASNVAHNVGNTVSNTAHNVVNTASNVAHNVGNTVSNTAHNVVNTASNVAHNVGNTASNVAKNVSSTASNVAKNVSSSVSSTVKSAQNTAQKAWGWLTGH